MSLIERGFGGGSRRLSENNSTQVSYTLYKDLAKGKIIARKHSTVCSDLAKISYRCLEEFSGDKSMCQDFFEAFNMCRQGTLGNRQQKIITPGAKTI